MTNYGTNANMTAGEVKERLASYQDSGITDELSGFGSVLLADAISRISTIDAKAGIVAGYSGAIITLILSTSGIWSHALDRSSACLLLLAIVGIFLAGAFSIYSMALQSTEWFTANEWMRSECLVSRERLRRYHILCTWGIVASHQEKYRIKVARLRKSQWLLAVAFLLLFISLFEIALRHAPL